MKNGDGFTHLPVNVPRLIWNAKQQFSIKPNQITDLHPRYVLTKMQELLDELTVFPRIKTASDSLSIEANKNSTIMTKIQLKSMLSTRQMILHNKMTQTAFDQLIGEIKSRFE